ncbi:MAG: GNAT family N-acetyltransferase [Caldilineaceae bacterium]
MRSPFNLPDFHLMSLHIQTLYVCDHNGRLLAVNEPGNPSAPRFYLGRTPSGNQWRFRHDLPAAIVAQLEALCQAEPVTSDLHDQPQHYAAIKAVLAAQAPIEAEYRGPAYWIPADVTSPPEVVLIDDSTAHLLQSHFPWATDSDPYYAMGPVAAVIADGCAISICFCSRTPGQATEAGLETVTAYRGKGYAGAAVAGWAAAVRQRGWLPLYSTSWENRASQRVADKLGLVSYGEDWSMD